MSPFFCMSYLHDWLRNSLVDVTNYIFLKKTEKTHPPLLFAFFRGLSQWVGPREGLLYLLMQPPPPTPRPPPPSPSFRRRRRRGGDFSVLLLLLLPSFAYVLTQYKRPDRMADAINNLPKLTNLLAVSLRCSNESGFLA